ncbi:MAG: hypothetical protein WC782_03175 [Methylococcaceae bacterium]|jgi:hypothetical protein
MANFQQKTKGLVKASESQLISGLSQSKKMAAILNRAGHEDTSETHAKLNKLESKDDVSTQLQLAQTLINVRISEILQGFPAGKQKKLFKFKFGTVEDIQSMRISDAFKHLGIDPNLVNINLLLKIDYFGRHK